MTVIIIPTPEDMAALGARIAGDLRAGDVLALDGELGAGKTTFTRGLGVALGVRGAVTSPTFVLARTHQRGSGDPPLVHVDAYRLGGAAEFDDLDLDLAGSITVVEWAGDLLEQITDSVLSIRIVRPTGAAASAPPGESDDDEQIEPRTVTIGAIGPGWADRAARLDVLDVVSGGEFGDMP